MRDALPPAEANAMIAAHLGSVAVPAPPIAETEAILCPHCKRTASNGIKCKGICVAENDY